MDQDLVITWLEDTICGLNNKLTEHIAMEWAFLKCGQDFRGKNITQLMDHLACIKQNSIYSSLQENQAALLLKNKTLLDP